MPSLSVCMIVQNAEKTLAIALESLNRVYDDLIIVDGGSTDSTCEIALGYGARVIKSQWSGNHGQQRNVYLREIKTEWAFVLDSDEFIDIQTIEFFQDFKQNKLSLNTDNFWIPRKWISPNSQKHYIASSPHYPDFQRRLFQNKEGIFYQGRIHDIVQGFTQPDGCLMDLSIYHLDLFINTEEKRREKVRRYSQEDPRDGGRHFYLPNLETIQLEELDLKIFIPLVQAKLDEIQKEDMPLQDAFSLGLIPPEIKNDEFYNAIERIAREENIKTILEIGSSAGEGSTEAFVNGLRENANNPTLFCMEVSKTRFAELQNRYGNEGFVKCYNVSSVPLEAFPSQDEFIRFYQQNYTNLKIFPLNKILQWLKQDIAYINEAKVAQTGIKIIKNENDIDFFDVVLIDGSEFTGKAELDEVYGANYILLDDIQTFKNYQNFYRLANDDSYSLIAQDRYLRNGYAIFKKVSSQLLNQRPLRKVLFSVGVEELAAEFNQFTSPRFQEYANYYGFEYREITEYVCLTERKQEWIKIDYVLKLLSELQTGDLIAFLDANIAIVRGDIELNTYKSIGLAKDSSGVIDSGIWVVRVNEFSKRFFEAVWNQNEGERSPFSEQIALQKVVLQLSPQEQENHIEILPNCLNVTLVKGEFPLYDIYRKNPCLEPIRFRHFAGGQPWIGKYFSQPVIFNASVTAPISDQRSRQNSIPIVFIHQGDSDYLKYTLSQAKHSNPDSTVFLIGDAANAHYYNLAEFVDIFKYSNDAVEFAKIYKHYNTNSLGYELFCFQRWFILNNFLLENKIDKCLYIDSDVMLYANVAKEKNKFKKWDLTLSYETSPHCVFINNLKTLEDFCNFLCEIYTDPSLLKLMESKFEDRIQQNLPGGACDMTAFIEYRKMHPSKIGELSTIIDNSRYDHNINLSEGFEMQDGIKKIYFVNGQPCCKDLKFGNQIKFNCLHFQGNAKKYIKKYLTGRNLLTNIEILPVHFFTIVLNGKPFIEYHIEIFKQLPFKWHWHIVEGVADLKHDTSWSLRLGGCIPDELHQNGRSIDGTTEYIDELAKMYPDYVTVYRKPEGVFWEGKREMVNEPLFNIKEECLLWQVDVDEFWTPEQICTAREMFIDCPSKTAAFYWSWFFVGKNLVVSTRNCYSQNPQQDWLRTWRYKPGAVWVAHEPPTLVEPLPNGQWSNIAAVNPFLHAETEAKNLVFQHFAYTIEKQLQFKEQYYGYQNAVAQWMALQKQSKFPVLLREYFSWVGDDTLVNTAESCGIVAIAQIETSSNSWQFLSSEQLQRKTLEIEKLYPRIIVDGVFFQLYQTGIARVWSSLLEEWSKTGFCKHILVLDRDGTAPKIPGIRYLSIPSYDYNRTDTDREMLQQVCDEEGADLFVSTYYTTPISTPSAFMAYDMVPEAIGADLNKPMWQEKHYGIRHASAYIAISENTAQDLVKFFPDISRESVVVAPCGVDSTFSPADPQEVELFKMKYGIFKPYFLLVGGRKGNKNAIFFFRAFSKLFSKQGFEIVCVGGDPQLEAEFRAYTPGNVVHVLQLSDEELRFAYSGAVALIYPSKYEGFGLPVLEAMACGCPVITCANASIPEVAGDAAIYVDDSNENELADALCEVQKPDVRALLSEAGLEQAKQFSWSKMAKIVSIALMETSIAEIEKSLLPLKLNEINLIIFPDWSAPEESLYLAIASAIKAVITHPDKARMTLLIDTSNISDEDADMAVSSVAMDLLMEEELGESEGVEISLVGDLRRSQWDALLRRVQVRISLERENELAIAQAKAQDLPCLTTDSLSDRRAVQLGSGTWILQ